MKVLMLLAMGVLAVSATTAKAVDSDAIIGGAIGGGAGAAVGSAVGGRNGAIIGGAIGGGAGAAVATSGRRDRDVVVVRERERHDNGRHLGHYKNKHKHGRGYDD
jgi:outer membrane lipoprotein SlyB